MVIALHRVPFVRIQEKYKSLVIYGSTPIETNLHENLVEHLNAEIVLETVANLGDAMTWLRSTFFYVRSIRRQVVLETGGASAASATMDDEGKIEKCLRGEYLKLYYYLRSI